jgi:hypothetical protein
MRIDAVLLHFVATWAHESHKAFQPNGKGRQYGILQRADLTPPDAVWKIKHQIIAAHGLQSTEQEPMFKDLCGYITDGGAVHPHSDPDHNGKQHVRFNVMVSKPEAGGVPVQDGVEIAVQEGDVWRCDASRVTHWCTPVVGSKPRIVLSYGFLI